MRFDELNWMDVEAYLKNEDRLILVLGACEQHGYLSLLTDARIPAALADAVSQKTGVLVAPLVNYGVSPYFATYPGTISLRPTTLMDLAEDVIRSVYAYGFRRILILNGHGGNDGVRGRLNELINQLPGLKIAWYSWWIAHSVEEVARKHDLKPNHANWLEAFSFTQVAEMPEGEKVVNPPKRMLNADETRQVYGDGSFGGYYQASPEIMDEMFAAILQDALYLIDFDD